jgi:hypothetical protein
VFSEEILETKEPDRWKQNTEVLIFRSVERNSESSSEVTKLRLRISDTFWNGFSNNFKKFQKVSKSFKKTWHFQEKKCNFPEFLVFCFLIAPTLCFRKKFWKLKNLIGENKIRKYLSVLFEKVVFAAGSSRSKYICSLADASHPRQLETSGNKAIADTNTNHAINECARSMHRIYWANVTVCEAWSFHLSQTSSLKTIRAAWAGPLGRPGRSRGLAQAPDDEGTGPPWPGRQVAPNACASRAIRNPHHLDENQYTGAYLFHTGTYPAWCSARWWTSHGGFVRVWNLIKSTSGTVTYQYVHRGTVTYQYVLRYTLDQNKANYGIWITWHDQGGGCWGCLWYQNRSEHRWYQMSMISYTANIIDSKLLNHSLKTWFQIWFRIWYCLWYHMSMISRNADSIDSELRLWYHCFKNMMSYMISRTTVLWRGLWYQMSMRCKEIYLIKSLLVAPSTRIFNLAFESKPLAENYGNG